MITHNDPVELIYLSAVAEVVEKRRHEERRQLAHEIIGLLSKALK